MGKLMMLAAMLAMVLAAAAPALAQDVPLIDQSETEEGGDSANVAGVDCTQVLQQVGGDQYAGAVGTGEGDVAAANNQEFTAEQVQQCIAIAGEGNAAAANVGDVNVDDDGDGTTDEEDGSEDTGSTENGVDGADDDGDGTTDEEDGSEHEAASAVAGGAEAEAGDDGAEASAGGASAEGDDDSGATLPDTGGISPVLIGAGALLVAGGLIARKLVR